MQIFKTFPASLVACGFAVSVLVACQTGAAADQQETREQESVKPGINDSFLNPDLSVDTYVDRFEGESREIAHSRAEIAAVVGLEPGMSVVDVGAGTGLFLEPFSEAVGADGIVYAVEIAEPFVEHIRERAAEAGLTQVQARLCTATSIELPENSVDRVFICDVYHHFEYPDQSLASIYKALRPGGEMLIVDFERIPGVTSDWLLEHVRAGKEVFRAEIESAGFEFVEEVEMPELQENYVLRFRRP